MARNKPDKPHVFCIGWHKTGTSTMGMALISLGYSVLGARLDMAKPLLNGDAETPLVEAGRFDAVQDVPWAALYRELDAKYPGSKFILTIRDQDSWLESASKHFGSLDVDLHRWLYGKGALIGNEELYLHKFQQHYREVAEYFENREGDLLVMDLQQGDEWSKLCAFLELPVPKKEFPHANKGRYNFSWKELFLHRLRNLIPWWIRNTRVKIMQKFGLHKGRNRFNNFDQNQEWRSKS